MSTHNPRMDRLYARLAAAGYPRERVDECLPEWWEEYLADVHDPLPAAWATMLLTLAQRLDLDMHSLANEDAPVLKRRHGLSEGTQRDLKRHIRYLALRRREDK